MITKFKLFENLSKLPKIGDYVIIDCESFTGSDDKELYDLYSNNVGKIIGGDSDENYYDVQWEKTPELKGSRINYFRKMGRLKNVRQYHISFFECWSDDKEELEAHLSAKKYNL